VLPTWSLKSLLQSLLKAFRRPFGRLREPSWVLRGAGNPRAPTLASHRPLKTSFTGFWRPFDGH
jgi:hypothetical protein